MATGPATISAREQRFGSDASLRGRTARGTVVNGLFLTFVNGLLVLRGFVVASFLTTTQYGVWGVLLAIIATLLILKQIGVAEKFVQQDDEDQVRAFHLAFTFELIASVAFSVLGALMLVAGAAIYDIPQIIAPGIVLLAILPLGALQMPLVVFYRRMDFVKQRLLQGVDPIVGFIVAVALAIAGAGYWSIVIGSVAGAACAAAVAVTASPYPLGFAFDRAQARGYLSFSWPILVAGLSAVVTAQGLIAGGKAALGLAGIGVIALVATISQFADRADRAITETLYPAICAVKDRVDLLFESFVTSNRLALMWAVPFGAGMALFSQDVLVRVLGPEWRPGVHLLQATAVALAIHQVGFNWQAFYRARGDTRPIAVAGIVGVVTFAGITLPLLLIYELDGLAIGVLASEIVFLIVRMAYLRRLFPALRAVRHLVRALAPSAPAVAAVLLMRVVANGHRNGVEIAAEAALYVALTALCTWRLERPLIAELVSYLRRAPVQAAPSPIA